MCRRSMDKHILFSPLALSANRQKTFRGWPFKVGTCTAKEMAKAGFYTDTDGSVVCYFCLKALEGWEETDIPFDEHKAHAPYCIMVQTFDKPPESMSFGEVLQLEVGKRIRLKTISVETILTKFEEFEKNYLKQYHKKKPKRAVRKKKE